MTEESKTYKPGPSLSQETIQPTPGMQHPYPALASTSEYLNNRVNVAYKLVNVGEYTADDDSPIVSFGFKFCDALILRNPNSKNLRALAHITSGSDPKEYVQELLKFFESSADLEAMIVSAGDLNEKLIDACKNNGIRIVATFVVPKRDEHRAYQHDVIVIPEEARVLVNINELGVEEFDF